MLPWKKNMLLMHKIRILWYWGIRVLDSAAGLRANTTCDCRDVTHRCMAAKSACRFFDITWWIDYHDGSLFCPGLYEPHQQYAQLHKELKALLHITYDHISLSLTKTDVVISPWRGSVLGGNVVTIGGACFNSTDRIVAKFGKDIITQCQYMNNTQAHCVVPELPKVGQIDAQLSSDGGLTFNRTAPYLSGWISLFISPSSLSLSLSLSPSLSFSVSVFSLLSSRLLNIGFSSFEFPVSIPFIATNKTGDSI